MMQETLRPPVEVKPPAQAGGGFVRHLISGNYFYFLSAALMLLGCKLLMQSAPVDAAIFARTLKTLLVLQGYEALVILTALAIVWRLRALDDAFSLLLIELVLLLDPTFFSNSFFTMARDERAMLDSRGVLVNAACLALVPLKLLLLQAGLGLRFAAGAWRVLLFAGAFAWLAEGPLCRRAPLPGFSDTAYHYLLAWGPLALACLAPRIREAVMAADDARGDHLTGMRRAALGVLLIVLPLATTLAHFIECARVHDLFFYPFEFAPAVLALGVIAVVQAPRALARPGLLLAFCDLCAAVAVMLTLIPRPDLADRAVMGYAARPLPAFAAAHLPLILTGAGVAGIYGWFYLKFRYRPALWRLAGLALAGAVAGLASLEVVRVGAAAVWLGLRKAGAATVQQGGRALDWIAQDVIRAGLLWLGRHPEVCVGCVWAGLLGLAGAIRRAWTWFPLGLLTIWIAAGWLPGNRERWLPEMIQAAFILGLALDHRFNARPDRNSRYFLALVVIAIAQCRYLMAPRAAGAVVVAIEIALLLGAAWRTRHGGYTLLGLGQAGAFVVLGWRTFQIHLTPAELSIAAALTFFAAGIAITFNKSRLLCMAGAVEENAVASAGESAAESYERRDARSDVGTTAEGTEGRGEMTEEKPPMDTDDPRV